MASVNNAILAWHKAPPRMTCVSDIACKQTQAAGEVEVQTCATTYPLSASDRSRASCLSRSSLCCRRSSLCLWLSTEELLKRSNSAWSQFNWCCRVESCFSKSSLSLERQKDGMGWRNRNKELIIRSHVCRWLSQSYHMPLFNVSRARCEVEARWSASREGWTVFPAETLPKPADLHRVASKAQTRKSNFQLAHNTDYFLSFTIIFKSSCKL